MTKFVSKAVMKSVIGWSLIKEALGVNNNKDIISCYRCKLCKVVETIDEMCVQWCILIYGQVVEEYCGRQIRKLRWPEGLLILKMWTVGHDIRRWY